MFIEPRILDMVVEIVVELYKTLIQIQIQNQQPIEQPIEQPIQQPIEQPIQQPIQQQIVPKLINTDIYKNYSIKANEALLTNDFISFSKIMKIVLKMDPYKRYSLKEFQEICDDAEKPLDDMSSYMYDTSKHYKLFEKRDGFYEIWGPVKDIVFRDMHEVQEKYKNIKFKNA